MMQTIKRALRDFWDGKWLVPGSIVMFEHEVFPPWCFMPGAITRVEPKPHYRPAKQLYVFCNERRFERGWTIYDDGQYVARNGLLMVRA